MRVFSSRSQCQKHPWKNRTVAGRLRVRVLVRVPSSMVLCACVSVCVCVRLCASGRACLPVLQDEILEVLVFEESAAGVLRERCRMFCFTTPRPKGLELNSSKFELLTRALLVCRMCGKCHSESSILKQLVCLHHIVP